MISFYFFIMLKEWKIKSENIPLLFSDVNQGVLHIWSHPFQWFFADSKLTEISKNHNSIIKTSWKVLLIWLKNKACHAHLFFEPKIAVPRSIWQLQKKLGHYLNALKPYVTFSNNFGQEVVQNLAWKSC